MKFVYTYEGNVRIDRLSFCEEQKKATKEIKETFL